MKCIVIILTTLFFIFATKAFPLPAFDGNFSLPADFKLKSLQEIAKDFGFLVDGNGTIIYPSVDHRDDILNKLNETDGIFTFPNPTFPNSTFNNSGLSKRDDWAYTCSKRVGPNPLIYWFSAFFYVADRLKKVRADCHVGPNQDCINCACTGGAAIKLCRGGLSPPDFRVPNGEIGNRASLVINTFLLSFLGLARCGGAWPGCTDRYNCQFEGLATNGGLSEGWYVYLTQETNIPKCIPI
ncbi:hypothetical protein AOL_s00193g127 [Orbilia oligospora ATCC 24927]|uniref:Uncharacterized protein n=1 Tax=Arthrobotrys oligospora (strain ATCC 24927 / CBS 115.81 / DSM 1491) TaxID=756982 RepID=G1XRC8_ARTOA|nr:hypothetical protein AOL_s00193g127 [Orbilia oligospora ATCC 24927]EGX44399.1 hypothetical protein AOL_s00193g127 [Orbilia oligospora ATCC 24927]